MKGIFPLNLDMLLSGRRQFSLVWNNSCKIVNKFNISALSTKIQRIQSNSLCKCWLRRHSYCASRQIFGFVRCAGFYFFHFLHVLENIFIEPKIVYYMRRTKLHLSHQSSSLWFRFIGRKSDVSGWLWSTYRYRSFALYLRKQPTSPFNLFRTTGRDPPTS